MHRVGQFEAGKLLYSKKCRGKMKKLTNIQDPELWFRGGNCFIHLYAKGQSQRGPAFKVPFGALLAAQCHPLLHRSISRDNAKLNELGIDEFADLDLWCEMNPTRRVDLFIPAPPTQDKTDAFNYHLATRNFFAWVFRRSLVAEHLGNALISLHNTMADFRNDEDHMADLLDYMDEEGYLGVDDHPNHALAVLHFAEVFRVKDAYIHAFCHCAGMSEHLPSSPEYYVSSPMRCSRDEKKRGLTPSSLSAPDPRDSSATTALRWT